MSEKPNIAWPERRSFLLLVVFLFLVYNSNFRWSLTRDSIPARVLPFSLLLDGHLYLDSWVAPYMQGRFAHDPYSVQSARGHIYSRYPIVEPLAITPLYVLPAIWLRLQRPPLAQGSFELMFIVNMMEKISASLIAALSAGILYLALRKWTRAGAALAITLIYGLASHTWSAASQTLWRQGFTELSFALLLWALSRGAGASRFGFWVGLPVALAAANKPAYAVFAFLFFAYFGLKQRKDLFSYCAPLAILGVLVLSYNVYFFGRSLGAYPTPLGPFIANSPMNPAKYPWWHGFVGLLVSPNRGLFIFIPWTIFSCWGAVRSWKENKFGWERYLIIGLLAVYVIHARLGLWWGGGVYGPRYLCDLLPFLAFLLVPVFPAIRSSRLITAAFAATAVFALWVQIVGAYFYPKGYWDSTPVSIEVDPRRIWNWSDLEILRTWKAGPDRPEILKEAPLFFQSALFESPKPYVHVAVIGLDGERSQSLLGEIAKEPAAVLEAIVGSREDLAGEARKRVPAVKFFPDYRAMLDEVKPDAIFVESPENHLEILRECARRQIDGGFERPMAASAAEAREMELVASAANIKLIVNFESVFAPASLDLYGRVQGSTVGAVEKILARCGEAGDEHAKRMPEPPRGVKDDGTSESQGVLSTLGSEAVVWAVWLKGRASRVFAYEPNAQSSDNADDAVLLLQYPDATATLHLSRRWPYPQVRVEVFGPKGSLFATEDALFFRAAHSTVADENPHGQAVEIPLVMHETSSAVAYFIYHIQHDQPIEEPVSAPVSVVVAEILDAAKESLRTGRAVDLPAK